MDNDSFRETVSRVAGGMNRTEQKADELVQLVVFELDNEEYAVNITDIKEIIKTPDITPIPNAPYYISGIVNLRGKIAVVIDLEKRFALNREVKNEAEHIIVTDVGESTFGVIVDKVSEVINVPVSSIKPSPSLVSTKIKTDYIKGVVVLQKDKNEDSSMRAENDDAELKDADSRLLILLDLPKMLAEEELMSLGSQVQEVIKKEKL